MNKLVASDGGFYMKKEQAALAQHHFQIIIRSKDGRPRYSVEFTRREAREIGKTFNKFLEDRSVG
jgi:hypothetical protein